MNIREILRKNLIQLMDIYKVSQKELAEKLGVTPSAVNNWIKGSNSPNIEIVAQICFIFNISISELLDEKEELFLLDKKAIKKYQLLNEAGKKKADDYIDDLLENPKYQAKSLTEDQIATAVKEVIDSDSKDTGSLLFRLSHQEK